MPRLILLAIAFSILNVCSAQLPKDSELFIQFQKLDSTFFERSFNQCDTAYLAQNTHPDLGFFHDRGGIQNRQQFINAMVTNICGAMNAKPIRKPDAGSLQLYPLYENGVLYGAIQHGVHFFYLRDANQQDQYTGQAKFTNLWLLVNGQWLLRDVHSYDHK